MSAEIVTAPRVTLRRTRKFSLRREARAIRIMVVRELIRVGRNHARMVSSFTQPVLYLFVLGTGLSALLASDGPTIDLRTFMFPGVISMSVIMTASFLAGNLVWDREFGFLREILVAPVSRGSLILGKCLGGAVVATAQGFLILSLAGFAGVPYSPLLFAELAGEIFLAAFAITALGVAVAARMTSMQSFFSVQQMSLMPMIFLSGTVFPLDRLPPWLTVLTRVNPASYIVDVLRRTIFSQLAPGPRAALTSHSGPGVTWLSYRVPTSLELLLIGGFGLIMLLAGAISFSRSK
ncbi:MAG TPA: ABC transporter permease [Streptosporangiaceae bacterium]|jgi:ABC-2 type transport system permease protein